MPTLQQLCDEGKAHYEAGRVAAAIEAYQAATELFVDQRSTEPAAVEAFVRAAGNLCVCHETSGDLEACFRSARETLGIYPVIPKAYAAIGVCIMQRLKQQEEAAAASQSADAALPPPSPEDRRADPLRYITRLGGVLCSVDEAHACLSRAVLLSEGGLQASLGPHLEAAVRLISAQFISAAHAVQWAHRGAEAGALLASLCPPEQLLMPGAAPVFLATAPAAVRDTVKAIDPRNPRTAGAALPRQEAAAVIAHAARMAREEQRQQQQEGGEGESGGAHPGGPLPIQPVDFMLSGKPMAVRVCHSERGGLPRGVTLVRVDRPFAVAAWLTPSPNDGGDHAPPLLAGAQPGSRVEVLPDSDGTLTVTHIDPTTTTTTTTGGTPLQQPSTEEVMRHMEAAIGQSSSGGGMMAPKTVYCSCCGREVPMPAMMAGAASGCGACGSVLYCSADCEAQYADRHERFECALRVKLQSIVMTADQQSWQQETQPAKLIDEVPGSAWSARHFLCHVLPLAIAVYSGVCARAAGYERVAAQVAKGVHRYLLAGIPPAAAQAITELATLVDPAAVAVDAVDGAPAAVESAEGVLRAIVLLARLHQCPPPFFTATDAERAEHPFCFLYGERLLFRHSCEPNCTWSNATRTIVTSRLVYKGEELTAAVDGNEGSSSGGSSTAAAFPQHWPWQIRAKWLMRHHAIGCVCLRCERECDSLVPARGDLSADLVEQLLTGDRLRRPAIPEAATANHPTQHFHPSTHRVIAQSLAAATAGGPAEIKRALMMLEAATRAAAVSLLPSHYLLEDLRAAAARIAALDTSSEDGLALCCSLGRESLSFYEALWAGAIPAKVAIMAQLRPLVVSSPNAGRRAQLQPQQQQQTPTEDGASGEKAAKSRRRRPERPPPNYAEGSLAEHFYGSYQSWYGS